MLALNTAIIITKIDFLIQKLYKIVENYFRETKIRSFRATKINKNQGLIFKDNSRQLRRQLLSIQRLTFVFALMKCCYAAFGEQNKKIDNDSRCRQTAQSAY